LAEVEEQEQDHFAKQGKLFSELALQTYASTFITCFTLKARFIKHISKVYGYYFATLCSSLYKTLGWENNVVYSKLL